MLALAGDARTSVVCAGNSSSGLKETPAFGCPSVNIGSRQNGRLRGSNVIDVPCDAKAIEGAVKFCVEDSTFKKSCLNTSNPYWMGNAGKKIAEKLASVEINQDLMRKRMMLNGRVENGWFN